jgi:hypothetical protein
MVALAALKLAQLGVAASGRGTLHRAVTIGTARFYDSGEGRMVEHFSLGPWRGLIEPSTGPTPSGFRRRSPVVTEIETRNLFLFPAYEVAREQRKVRERSVGSRVSILP